MSTLLHISVSPRRKDSISRRLGDTAVETWKANNPGGRVIERDLAKTPLTFVDVDWIVGAFSPAAYHTENHKKALALSNELFPNSSKPTKSLSQPRCTTLRFPPRSRRGLTTSFALARPSAIALLVRPKGCSPANTKRCS